MSIVRFTLCCTCGLHVTFHGTDVELAMVEEGPCDQSKCPGCPGSQVYAFHGEDGLECCGCRFRDADRDAVTVFGDAAELAAHFEAHRVAGHHVPQWAIDGLLAVENEP